MEWRRDVAQGLLPPASGRRRRIAAARRRLWPPKEWQSAAVRRRLWCCKRQWCCLTSCVGGGCPLSVVAKGIGPSGDHRCASPILSHGRRGRTHTLRTGERSCGTEFATYIPPPDLPAALDERLHRGSLRSRPEVSCAPPAAQQGCSPAGPPRTGNSRATGPHAPVGCDAAFDRIGCGPLGGSIERATVTARACVAVHVMLLPSPRSDGACCGATGQCARVDCASPDWMLPLVRLFAHPTPARAARRRERGRRAGGIACRHWRQRSWRLGGCCMHAVAPVARQPTVSKDPLDATRRGARHR